MKRTAFAIVTMAAALFAAASCQKEAKTISVTVTIDETKIAEAGIPSPDSYAVTLTNFATGVSIEAATENGVASAAGLVPGLYNITATAVQSKDGFAYTITGALSDVNFLEDGEKATVKVDAVKEAALVFKEIYYTGCRFPTDEEGGSSTYFRDQFYEIYNNSTQTVYADGLCISTTIFANYDYTVFYEWPIENPENYVFCERIWQIPGDGTQYPIKPGESIIIAQWGTNHKAESLTKGTSPVDLSGAEFEALEKESTTWNGITLTDNIAVNMKLAVNATGYEMPQWLTSVGGATYILFKPSVPLKNEDFITATNADWGNVAREVPISEVIDAVQSVSDETRLSTLGLPAVLDAGAIWCSGMYVSESIARKVKETREDGTVVYQDTNNTTNDFEVKKDPQLRRNGAKVPSWNSWIK